MKHIFIHVPWRRLQRGRKSSNHCEHRSRFHFDAGHRRHSYQQRPALGEYALQRSHTTLLPEKTA